MEEENKTSYEASAFVVDASKLEFADNGQVKPEDFPAFVHEWWHYIQDITTITGQNGFYLWMRDIVRMTNITCNGVGKTITIPLTRDQHNEVYSKYRKLYNIFCGEKVDRKIDNPEIKDLPTIVPNGIFIDGEERTFAKCEVKINGETFYFGLIALQELNAFYAQKIAESYCTGIAFNVPADTLPEFPYQVGDMLFEYYNITCDIYTRFIITTRVLDTLQAPAVFLYLLEELRGKTLNYQKDRELILQTIDKVSKKHSYPNEAAITEWFKDYSNWINDEGHSMLKTALSWYLTVIGVADKAKVSYGEDIFEHIFCCGINALSKLYETSPVPLIKYHEEVLGQKILGNDKMSLLAQRDFENALVIWIHRRMYDLLRSETHEAFMKHSSCPIYNDGKCQYIKQYKEDKRYDCKMSPWMVVKGETKALCPYAVAAHSMGLWQNDLDVTFK